MPRGKGNNDLKRLLIFLCAVVMCLATFTACGEKDNSKKEAASTTTKELTKEEILEKEAKAVYDIVIKHGVENPETIRYTLTFCLTSETIGDKLKPELIDELKEHFGDKQGDYRIAIEMSKDSEVVGVMVAYEEEVRKAWAEGDYSEETVFYAEYNG